MFLKQFSYSLLILVYVGFVSACSKTPHRQLSIYNWANYIGSSTIKDFEKETGIKVTYDNFSNNEELLAKIQAGASGYDVIFPSDYMVRIMIKQGLLAPLDRERLTNLGNLDPRFINPEYDPGLKHCVPYHWGTAGIAVNTKYVKDPVHSWKVLWDPKYRGKISMLDDPRAGMNPAFGVLGLPLNSGSPADIAAARDKMIEQKPLVKVYTSDIYPELLRSEEVWLAQGFTGDVYQVAKDKKEIQYVIPDEGTEFAVDSMCIPLRAKNPELAHTFIDYVLRADVAASIANDIHYPSPNRAATKLINPEILNDPGIYPPPEVMARLHVQPDIGDANSLYDRAWSELKAR